MRFSLRHSFALIFVAFTLLSCSSSPVNVPQTYAQQADQAMSGYRLNKVAFYGYELQKPTPTLPSGVSVQFDKQSGGNKYIFPDPKGSFTFITLYENAGILTRITLTRADTSSSQSDRFYDNLLENARESYPANVLVNSGIGAYMHFLNDPDEWRKKYVEYLEKQDDKSMYATKRKQFHYGLHEFLRTVSFDQFPGQANKIYVSADYVAVDYEQASKNYVDRQSKSLNGI